MKRRRQVPPETENDSTAGSPTSGEPVYLAVGYLRRSHGIQGEVQMDIMTDFPERLRTGKTLYVGPEHEPLRLVSARQHGKGLIVRFAGFSNPEEAGRLRNLPVYVKAAGLPKLPEGEYYHHELLGSRVLDESGNELGIVREIIETGANDVYVVKQTAGEDLLFPAIENVVLGVDVERKEIRVRPLEWI